MNFKSLANVPRDARSVWLAACLLLPLATGTRAQPISFTVIKTFGNSDKNYPMDGLALTGNTLYGTTHSFDSTNLGMVFGVDIAGWGFATVHTFAEGNDSALPNGGLVLLGNALYGTTGPFGPTNLGNIYRLNTDGSGLAVLHTFNGGSDGAWPSGGLVVSGNTLYGTTFGGGPSGCGTVFKVSAAGSDFTTLYSFTGKGDWARPNGGLLCSGTTLYGTTQSGNRTNSDGTVEGYYGTVFRLNKDGSGFTTLHTFTGGSDGGGPNGGLVLSGNTLYGTTSGTDSSSLGAVFRLNTDGSGFVTVHGFTGGSEGLSPNGGLVLSAGRLYGTTGYGGTFNNGTLFSVNTDGSRFGTLYSPTGGVDGRQLQGGLLLSDSALYGTASGGQANLGTLFCIRIGPSSVAAATPIVDSGFVVGGVIRNAGYGYTNPPLVRFTGGGGTGAQATAIISNGLVIGIDIVSAGSGYTNPPTLSITPPWYDVPRLGVALAARLGYTGLVAGTAYQQQVATASNAWAEAGQPFTAASTSASQYGDDTGKKAVYRLVALPLPWGASATCRATNGFVVAATLTSGGHGYIAAPGVRIVGGGGTGARASATVSNGAVITINILSAGSGYTSTPTVEIDSPPPAPDVSPTTIGMAIRLDVASLISGVGYQLEASPDLGVWTNAGSAWTATDTTTSQYLDMNGERGFFRLEYVP